MVCVQYAAPGGELAVSVVASLMNPMIVCELKGIEGILLLVGCHLPPSLSLSLVPSGALADWAFLPFTFDGCQGLWEG